VARKRTRFACQLAQTERARDSWSPSNAASLQGVTRPGFLSALKGPSVNVRSNRPWAIRTWAGSDVLTSAMAANGKRECSSDGKTRKRGERAGDGELQAAAAADRLVVEPRRRAGAASPSRRAATSSSWRRSTMKPTDARTWNYAGGPMALDGRCSPRISCAPRADRRSPGSYRRQDQCSLGFGDARVFRCDARHDDLAGGQRRRSSGCRSCPTGSRRRFRRACLKRAGGGTRRRAGAGSSSSGRTNNAHIAGYMYDSAGNPVWYLLARSVGQSGPVRRHVAALRRRRRFREGHTGRTDRDPDVGVRFRSASRARRTAATLTLPDGRRIPLVRQAF
jgi:hypothetical protein